MRLLPLFSSPRAFLFSARFLYLTFLALSFLVADVPALRAQTPEETVRGLAKRLAEIREVPERVVVEWTNVSSLPEAESIILREAFLKELSSRRQIAVADVSVPLLQVAVRESPTDFLLVAHIATASGEQVRIADIARTAFLPVMTRGTGLRLAKQLLWQQAETILDAAEFLEFPASAVSGGRANSVADIFILKPDALAIYHDGGEQLSEMQELPFGGYKYVSRALRGEMRRGKDGGVVVTLPGLNCVVRGPVSAGERWSMQCSSVASPATSTVATNAAPPAVDAEATALSSNCDANSWRLIGEASDWTQPDRLLLVNAEMKREEAVAALDFAGPVRHVANAEDGKSALAVVFDLSSGSYEIYRITMACGR